MVELIHEFGDSCHHKNHQTPLCSSEKLLLIHLPTEILSKIITELLKECTETPVHTKWSSKGVLDRFEFIPFLKVNHIVPLGQVNKFFNHLV